MESKEASPERFIAEVESFDFMGDTDKATLILVMLGEKPAHFFTLSEEKYAQNAPRLKDFLEKERLSYVEGTRSDPEDGEITHQIYIAREPAIVARFASIVDKGHNEIGPEKEEEIGTLLGFPATATAAYRMLRKGEGGAKEIELPLEFEMSPERDFLFFRPSLDHWQEEIEVAKRYADIIKEKAPDLYVRVTDLRRKFDAMRDAAHPQYFQKILHDDKKMALVQARDPELYNELMKEKKN